MTVDLPSIYMITLFTLLTLPLCHLNVSPVRRLCEVHRPPDPEEVQRIYGAQLPQLRRCNTLLTYQGIRRLWWKKSKIHGSCVIKMHSWYVLYETVEVASWSGYGPAWVHNRVMGEWVVGQSDRVCGVFSDLLWI